MEPLTILECHQSALLDDGVATARVRQRRHGWRLHNNQHKMVASACVCVCNAGMLRTYFSIHISFNRRWPESELAHIAAAADDSDGDGDGDVDDDDDDR